MHDWGCICIAWTLIELLFGKLFAEIGVASVRYFNKIGWTAYFSGVEGGKWLVCATLSLGIQQQGLLLLSTRIVGCSSLLRHMRILFVWKELGGSLV